MFFANVRFFLILSKNDFLLYVDKGGWRGVGVGDMGDAEGEEED